MMETADFLKTVVTGDKGWFCLALANGNGWLEEWHHWPEDLDKIVRRADEMGPKANVYFSSYLFRAPQSVKENVLQSRTIQADLDDADLSTLPRRPTVLVRTSPGRHQAYWVLSEQVGLDVHETLSRKLTYSIPLCDRSGWPLGRKVRIPNTFNHKYLEGPKPVEVVSLGGQAHSPVDLELLPEVPAHVVEFYDENFIAEPQTVKEHPLQILERIKEHLPSGVYVRYDITAQDRSAALWALLCHAFRAGLSRNEVFTLAKGSKNNKFADLRYRADQELAKDVLRAEHAVRSELADDRQVILDMRLSQMGVLQRKTQMLDYIITSMRKQGEFFNSTTEVQWYVRRDVGRPVMLMSNSSLLDTLLDMQFGLNQTEMEQKYIVAGLQNHAHTLPPTSIQSALSYYDDGRKQMLLHTGRKDVMRITPESIERVTDGSYGVVFPWIAGAEGFAPNLNVAQDYDWGHELFGDGSRGFGSSTRNMTNLDEAQALATLKVWLMFLLFRQAAVSRPIIATFGQPGSGKTTLFRKVFRLLYGPNKDIGGITEQEDFDHAVSHDPFVVFDNVDTWAAWLPDRIAQSAGISDIPKRRLYTNDDTFILKRQAMVGVSAHNPKFGREDVADRFLLFAFSRLPQFESEQAILADILKQRNNIWGAIIHDIQRVLRTPIPTSGIPQFRVEDFARLGFWIASAIGEAEAFVDAIATIKSSQKNFSLEEEGMLVGALISLCSNATNQERDFTASTLWTVLEGLSGDPNAFRMAYRNAVGLSKKLSSMQEPLSARFIITTGSDSHGRRTWRFKNKP